MKNLQYTEPLANIEKSGYYQAKETLHPSEIRNILQISNDEFAKLSLEMQQIYQRIRSLASFCGGWSEQKNYNHHSEELTLREYCII